MEKTLLTLAEIIIPGIVVVVCLLFLADGITTPNNNGNNATGIYNVLGTVPTVEEADDNIHTIPDGVESAATAEPPVVTYNNQIVKAWDVVAFKELFKVTTNGVTYNGDEESIGKFSIQMEDITDKQGTSVMTVATDNIIDEGDDMYIIALYNTSDNTIYFTEAGMYKIRIKVTDKNGNTTNTTVAIPVELNF